MNVWFCGCWLNFLNDILGYSFHEQSERDINNHLGSFMFFDINHCVVCITVVTLMLMLV